MEKTQLIDKIKALLALSSDQATTVAERNLALQRAQQLMAKYSVDVSQENKPEEIIEQEFIYSPHLPIGFSNPLTRAGFYSLISNQFGCYVLVRCDKIYLFGFRTNIEVASHAIECIINQGIADYREEYKKQRSIGFSISFWEGFKRGLVERFSKMSDENAIILYDRVKEQLMQKCDVLKIPILSSNAVGSKIGQRSAQEAQIRKGVPTGQGGKLLC